MYQSALAIAAGTCAFATAVPAAATAATWTGTTKQGRPVTVVTGADDMVKRVAVARRARCRHGR